MRRSASSTRLRVEANPSIRHGHGMPSQPAYPGTLIASLPPSILCDQSVNFDGGWFGP
jgi:hypothetical protein